MRYQAIPQTVNTMKIYNILNIVEALKKLNLELTFLNSEKQLRTMIQNLSINTQHLTTTRHVIKSSEHVKKTLNDYSRISCRRFAPFTTASTGSDAPISNTLMGIFLMYLTYSSI